jgi:dTDP-4-dehydrorhamnose reductase
MKNDESRIILLTGISGQVGFELTRTLQGLGQIVAMDRNSLDLLDLYQVRRVVRDVRPALIVNPGAYTAVDRAETDVASAMRINAHAPAVLAEETKRLGAALVHFSTDYVFDGTKQGTYVETDATGPQNVYGRSKLDGERAIEASGCHHLILRTSWVYGTRGKNFLMTMLRLAGERNELNVVDDQRGAPTWSNTVATLTSNVLAQAASTDRDARQSWWSENSGVYHLTAGGETTWHGFACAIFECAGCGESPRLNPIDTASYPTPARRPENSVLSNHKLAQVFGLRAPHWRDALRLCMQAR